MTTPLPPLDDSATRLLAIMDGIPIRLSDRDRVARALDIGFSTEWTRVLVRLSADQLESLRLPGLMFTPNDLGHVTEFARVIAGSGGFENTGAGHIAVALALTTRVVNDDRQDLVSVIGEAFGTPQPQVLDCSVPSTMTPRPTADMTAPR